MVSFRALLVCLAIAPVLSLSLPLPIGQDLRPQEIIPRDDTDTEGHYYTGGSQWRPGELKVKDIHGGPIGKGRRQDALLGEHSSTHSQEEVDNLRERLARNLSSETHGKINERLNFAWTANAMSDRKWFYGEAIKVALDPSGPHAVYTAPSPKLPPNGQKQNFWNHLPEGWSGSHPISSVEEIHKLLHPMSSGHTITINELHPTMFFDSFPRPEKKKSGSVPSHTAPSSNPSTPGHSRSPNKGQMQFTSRSAVVPSKYQAYNGRNDPVGPSHQIPEHAAGYEIPPQLPAGQVGPPRSSGSTSQPHPPPTQTSQSIESSQSNPAAYYYDPNRGAPPY